MVVVVVVMGGSIPAHAGEPCRSGSPRSRQGVYPRPCGGAVGSIALNHSGTGLSPPMRGSRPSAQRPHGASGSIPAHAGEPWGMRSSLPPTRVYPRPCGGARDTSGDTPMGMGLSPPMRGSPQIGDGDAVVRGSIPAHAGEPVSRVMEVSNSRVYPRPCGGAGREISSAGATRGLSPPMRGSPEARQETPHGNGSIPAHAGEPWRAFSRSSHPWVYPRPCGGATSSALTMARPMGLSPPMRGSLSCEAFIRPPHGSIPAHAGEPLRGLRNEKRGWVYPRPCGGAATEAEKAAALAGLSPPMRGSPGGSSLPDGLMGSIPAHAGEPTGTWSRGTSWRVYPRPCGGALGTREHPRLRQGLSPPMRGSPRAAVFPPAGRGSIPAHAGEPSQA